MTGTSITVVVTAHREGPLLHPTLRSVQEARERAIGDGHQVDVLLMLDNPDDSTRDYVASHASDLKVLTCDFGDPAAARNLAVTQATGDLVALLDGDDLFGREWLARAAAHAATEGECFVLHPECVVCFGVESLVAFPVDSRSPRFRPKALLRGNLWNSVHVVAPRELLLTVPFQPTSAESGLGFEDWHWHAEIASRGIPHRIVPQTVVFYRRKDLNSRLAGHLSRQTLLPPSSLLRPDVYPFLDEPRVQA